MEATRIDSDLLRTLHLPVLYGRGGLGGAGGVGQRDFQWIRAAIARCESSANEVGHPLLLPEPVRFPCETHQTHDSN